MTKLERKNARYEYLYSLQQFSEIPASESTESDCKSKFMAQQKLHPLPKGFLAQASNRVDPANVGAD